MITATVIITILFLAAAFILIAGILVTGFAWLIVPLLVDILMIWLLSKVFKDRKDKKEK